MSVRNLSPALLARLEDIYEIKGDPPDDLRWLDGPRVPGMAEEHVREAVANSCQNLGWNPAGAWWVDAVNGK